MSTQKKQYNRHDGFFTLTKLPSEVAKLFTQGPPQPPSKLPRKPAASRKYELGGVSNTLAELENYKRQYKKVSQNKYLEVYDDALNETRKKQDELMKKIQLWDPQSDPNISTDPYRTLFVGRLDYSVDEVELQMAFVKYGEIESCRIVRDKEGKSRGYGFVQFVNYEDSKHCFRELGVRKGVEIRGRNSIVDIERGRTVKYFKPRRLGGGLGGRGYQKRDLLSRLTPQENRKPPFRRPFQEKPVPVITSSHYEPSPGSAPRPPPRSTPRPAASSYRSRRDRLQQDPASSKPDALSY